MRYVRHIIGEIDNRPANMNTFLRVADINGDGWPDIVVGGRNGALVWFENPESIAGEWERRIIEPDFQNRECGGLVAPLTDSGYADVLVGGDWQSDGISWWENPGPNGRRAAWPRRLVTRTSRTQFHDVLLGDVTGDGKRSLIFWNQDARGNTGSYLFRLPVPDDPRKVIGLWPGLEQIAEGVREAGLPEEGLVLADLDGDGINEIVAGTHWYRREKGVWRSHRYIPERLGYVTTVLAVADFDGDGRPEIAVSEGDPCIYGRKEEGGRLAWFKPDSDGLTGLWEEHRLAEGLWDAHSLQAGNLCGNGRVDLLVGEIGVRDDPAKIPHLTIWENKGRGDFTPHVIDEGIGTHHAQLVDLEDRGVLDIISRPLHGPDKWKVFVWRREE